MAVKNTVGFQRGTLTPLAPEPNQPSPQAKLSRIVANWWGDLADRLEEAVKSQPPNQKEFELVRDIARQNQCRFGGDNPNGR